MTPFDKHDQASAIVFSVCLGIGFICFVYTEVREYTLRHRALKRLHARLRWIHAFRFPEPK